jgi:hypothetical protein
MNITFKAMNKFLTKHWTWFGNSRGKLEYSGISIVNPTPLNVYGCV